MYDDTRNPAVPQAGSRTVSSILRVQNGNHEVDDVARGAELPGVTLRAEDGEQVLEGVAQALGMIVGEGVDGFLRKARRVSGSR